MYTCTCTIGTSVIMLVTPTSVSGMHIVKRFCYYNIIYMYMYRH